MFIAFEAVMDYDSGVFILPKVQDTCTNKIKMFYPLDPVIADYCVCCGAYLVSFLEVLLDLVIKPLLNLTLTATKRT